MSIQTMSITLTDNDKWTIDYAIDSYKTMEEMKGYILWRSKKELKHGEIENFYKAIGISKATASNMIKHYEAKYTISIISNINEYVQTSEHIKKYNNEEEIHKKDINDITEDEALDIILDETNPLNKVTTSLYVGLQGKTPQEKVKNLEEVKKHTEKEKVSYRDIISFNKQKKEKIKVLNEQLKPQEILAEVPEVIFIPLLEKEAIKQTNKEFNQDYWELCSGSIGDSMDVFTIGFEIHKFDKDWHSIKRILSKAAHPDVGGSEEAMQFVSFLNKVFKDKKTKTKENQLKKDMTDRITELMGIEKQSK